MLRLGFLVLVVMFAGIGLYRSKNWGNIDLEMKQYRPAQD